MAKRRLLFGKKLYFLLTIAQQSKSNSFYSDEPELMAISKVKRILISIYDEQRKKKMIIKDKEKSISNGLAFISYQDTGTDLSYHYNFIGDIKT